MCFLPSEHSGKQVLLHVVPSFVVLRFVLPCLLRVDISNDAEEQG